MIREPPESFFFGTKKIYPNHWTLREVMRVCTWKIKESFRVALFLLGRLGWVPMTQKKKKTNNVFSFYLNYRFSDIATITRVQLHAKYVSLFHIQSHSLIEYAASMQCHTDSSRSEIPSAASVSFSQRFLCFQLIGFFSLTSGSFTSGVHDSPGKYDSIGNLASNRNKGNMAYLLRPMQTTKKIWVKHYCVEMLSISWFLLKSFGNTSSFKNNENSLSPETYRFFFIYLFLYRWIANDKNNKRIVENGIFRKPISTQKWNDVLIKEFGTRFSVKNKYSIKLFPDTFYSVEFHSYTCLTFAAVAREVSPIASMLSSLRLVAITRILGTERTRYEGLCWFTFLPFEFLCVGV